MFSIRKKIHIDTTPEKIDAVLSRGVSAIVEKDHLREALLSGKQLRVKLGIDPTSPHLHIGRAVPLLKLRDFQELGHTVVFIIGDTTGIIGDTSDKDSERPLLKKEEVQKNAETYFAQAGKILDMSTVEKHFNSQWLLNLNYNDIGEHADVFSVADFIARDNIRKRLDAGKRVSLREVLYPLMQGYDSVAVRADVEIGGTDQWFNLLAGRKLQERLKQEPQNIVTTELIQGTDGRKMSSSWGNTINVLDEAEDMYGKIMSIPDDLVISYFTHCTRVPTSHIKEMEEEIKSGGNPRDIKMQLAQEIVRLFHGDEKSKKAEAHFVNTFQKKDTGEATTIFFSEGELHKNILLREGVVSSGNEFSRLVASGALTSVTTKEVIKDVSAVAQEDTFKLGKRRFYTLKKK